MHSHLASLTIELLSSWSVVLVDDSTQIIKSRFIDFFAFLFSRNKLTCTLLVHTHVLSYWLWSILQFILHCTGNSIFFGSVLLFCARSFWYLYYNVPVYRHIKITCPTFVNLLFWMPYYGGCESGIQCHVIISLGIIKMYFCSENIHVSKQETPFLFYTDNLN